MVSCKLYENTYISYVFCFVDEVFWLGVKAIFINTAEGITGWGLDYTISVLA